MELLNSSRVERPEPDEIIKGINGLAVKMKVSRPTVHNWVNRGRIPVMKEGSISYFNYREVLEALKKK